MFQYQTKGMHQTSATNISKPFTQLSSATVMTLAVVQSPLKHKSGIMTEGYEKGTSQKL